MIYPKLKEERKNMIYWKTPVEVGDKAVKLYNKNLTINEIAKECGICVSTVAKIIKERKEKPELFSVLPQEEKRIKRTVKKGVSEEIKDKICELYNEDYTIPNIAKEVNLAEGTVYRFLRERRRLAAAMNEKVDEQTFNDYFFKKDTNRLYSGKEIKSFYEECSKNNITDWKEFIDEKIKEGD